MKFLSIEKKHTGRYLHRYDLNYLSTAGEPVCYEMISRRADIDSPEKLSSHGADAVVMVVRDEADEHMLLIHEYRMELGRWIYGLPGGLIEAGESAADCAARELLEETGLEIYEIQRIYPSAACTVGVGDEQTVCVFARAGGSIRPRHCGSEEIEAGWYTREEILSLQETELFGSWALAYSRIWADNPF